MTEIKILSAKVITSKRGPDTIFLTVDLPNPAFPFGNDINLKLTAAAGAGAAYVEKHFGLTPEII